MKELDKLTMYETGLTYKNRKVAVGLEPGGGGALVFKVGLKKKTVPLEQILTNTVEAKPPGVCSADWVELSALESLIAIYVYGGRDGEVDRKAEMLARTGLWNMVRDLRDNRRIDNDEPPVSWSPRKLKETPGEDSVVIPREG